MRDRLLTNNHLNDDILYSQVNLRRTHDLQYLVVIRRVQVTQQHPSLILTNIFSVYSASSLCSQELDLTIQEIQVTFLLMFYMHQMLLPFYQTPFVYFLRGTINRS